MHYQAIVATLEARTAVHVGSGEGNNTTDALIRCDAAGDPLIPGTAVAGALRSLLTRLAPRLGHNSCLSIRYPADKIPAQVCGCAVCQLFGDINPLDQEKNRAAASRLLVFNAQLDEETPRIFVRDGVGIDRVTGAAARAGRVKFDLETLPAGVKFELRMELRGDDDQDRQLLAVGLAEWKAGRAWIGGRVARGLGAFDLTEIEFKKRKLTTADQLVAFLKADKPWQEVDPENGWLAERLENITVTPLDNVDDKRAKPYLARYWVEFKGTLQATGPLLTNDATASALSGFDHAPLLAQLSGWEQPVLSGAGLRGVLRSHAERIVRTLATLNNPGRNHREAKDWFLNHCPACDPHARRPRKDAPEEKLPPLESCDSLLLYKGEIGGEKEIEPEQLCLACQLFGSSRRGSRLMVEDAPYRPTGEQSRPLLKMLDFLAIDRFTGGGVEGAKFDALALWRPAFQLRLHLDNPQKWELGWLALLLRDLVEGWLRVGMGAAKGFGQVEIADLAWTLGYLHETDVANLELPGEGKRNASVYKEMSFDLTEILDSWLEAFRKKISFDRSKVTLPALDKDSYFGVVDHLYPVEVTR